MNTIIVKIHDISKQNFIYLQNEDINPQDLDKIADNYLQREKLLTKLEQLVNAKDGKVFIEENSVFWNETINNILTLDASNLDMLKTKTNETADHLRNILKNKSLLIYSK